MSELVQCDTVSSTTHPFREGNISTHHVTNEERPVQDSSVTNSDNDSFAILRYEEVRRLFADLIE